MCNGDGLQRWKTEALEVHNLDGIVVQTELHVMTQHRSSVNKKSSLNIREELTEMEKLTLNIKEELTKH